MCQSCSCRDVTATPLHTYLSYVNHTIFKLNPVSFLFTLSIKCLPDLYVGTHVYVPKMHTHSKDVRVHGYLRWGFLAVNSYTNVCFFLRWNNLPITEFIKTVVYFLSQWNKQMMLCNLQGIYKKFLCDWFVWGNS